MLDPLIGEHPTLRNIRKRLPALATSSETLVIVGEHGTGKTLLAHHIHGHSSFAKNKLITVDCSLLKERDQRIMLFGGDLSEFSTTRRSPVEMQTTLAIKHPECAHKNHQRDLAEAIRSMFVTRTGSKVRIPVQCRVIFSLYGGLKSIEEADKLEPQLLSLLKQSKKITLPPLRKRRTDIPLLIRYNAGTIVNRNVKLSGFSRRGKPKKSLVRQLIAQRWRGNIAELKVFLRGLIIPLPDYVLDEKELLHLRAALAMIQDRKAFSVNDQLQTIRSLLIARAMNVTSGNCVQAAQLLGLTEGTLRDRHSR